MEGVQTKNLRVVVAPFEQWLPPATGGGGDVIFFYNKSVWVNGSGGYEQSLATDLESSRLFSSVEYRDWEELADSYNGYDLLISGKFYYQRMETRGPGILLFVPIAVSSVFLPIPVEGAREEIKFDLEVSLPSSPGFPLLKKEIIARQAYTNWGLTAGIFISKDKLPSSTISLLEVRKELAKELEPGGKIYSALQKTQK